MPEFTTPIPPKLTGNPEADVIGLKRWGTALIDELTYLFNNLDAGNVIESASVDAENINTNKAKISDAQIGVLNADKLSAGTVDTDRVSVKDQDGNLEINGSSITISDRSRNRFVAEYDKDDNIFKFSLCNKNGEPTVSINSRGDAVFKGTVESAHIFSSTIIGTDSESYENVDGGVFADVDQAGIKVMQDQNGVRRQKVGISVADDGTSYLVLGCGTGGAVRNINGVIYTEGSFKIEKNESYTNLGIVGNSPFIHFWDESGELWLNGSTVKINGVNLNNEIQNIKARLDNLENNSY